MRLTRFARKVTQEPEQPQRQALRATSNGALASLAVLWASPRLAGGGRRLRTAQVQPGAAGAQGLGRSPVAALTASGPALVGTKAGFP